MNASIIRGRHVITRALDRQRWEQIDDGAILQEDGIISRIGPFAELARAHPTLPVIGSGDDVVLPGFVNAHHHVGMSTIQLGIPDETLELWFATSIAMRDRIPYYDTLYGCFEMLASGITTAQHLHGWMPGDLRQTEAEAEAIIRAYEEVGMRLSYCYALREQNHLVYEANADFLRRVPADLQPALARYFDGFRMPAQDTLDLFETLHARHHDKPRVRIQLAPSNLQWCEDASLARLADLAERYRVPIHMHLVETPYQKEYARRRGGGTAVEHIARFGLLGPQVTLGHAIWLNESDLDRLAASGTCVCHNCSSNFRLRSGLLPLNAIEARGITTAIGLDGMGMNDELDMLQEMRVVLRAHREPGMDDGVPTVAQVFRMATAGGAATTPYGTSIGTLAEGKAADLVLIDWRQISYPYLDAEVPVLDAVIQRAKTAGVRTVMVGGEVLLQDGRFTRLDRRAALRELADILRRPLTADEAARKHLAKAVLPHVRAWYNGYLDMDGWQPFQRQNSRL